MGIPGGRLLQVEEPASPRALKKEYVDHSRDNSEKTRVGERVVRETGGHSSLWVEQLLDG